MGHFQSDEYKVFFCGQDHVRRNGVAIICDKDTSRCVMGYKPISDRIISIRLDGHPVRTTIIQIYAPKSAASEEDIEDLYGKLQDLTDTVPRGDVLIIMGDWNAQIGDKAVEGISGTHGLGDRNEAGERMIEFCEENQLIVTNTWYKQPRRRLYTWTTPDGLHRNQIDYIMIQKRWRSMVKSAKTMPGADCGTDHELLVATIQVKLKKMKKPETENRYNLCDIPERYAVEVKNRFAALDLIDREPEELWQEVEAIVKDEAKNNIPKARKPKKSKWLTKEAI